MYSAPRSIRAVAILILFGLCGTAAFPQAVKFIRHAADPLTLAGMSRSRAGCGVGFRSAATVSYATGPVTGDAGEGCDAPAVAVPTAKPCNPARAGQIGCEAPRDRVQENLASMGKTGQKIERARERVLEILQGENACSAWFREKDADPAATFRTLSYAVDRQGEELVHVSKDAQFQTIFRDPYVAQVGQDTGAFATVTLNAGGAFFHAAATMLFVPNEGGLTRFGGPRTINIGPYTGDTVAGETLALLHEFGHVLNLLPVDFDNEGGKSVQNTHEVLRFCRAEIESKVKRGALQATR
jgi:hypothetical protein